MNSFKKIIYLTILFTLSLNTSFAGNNFKGKTELEGTEFEVGEQFLVQYKLVTTGSYSLTNARFNLIGGDFGDLEIIRQGQDGGMNFDFSNEISAFTYKYFLKANKPGKYKIPAVTIVLNGKKYPTQAATVNIVAQTKDANVSGDLMLQLKPNKQNVYVGESIRYDLYWYSAYYSKGFQLKELPKFDGFIVETIQSKSQIKRRTINGKTYLTNKVCSFILTPIKSGVLKIPAVKGDMYLTSGRGFIQQTQTQELMSGTSTLKVKPLPSAPSNVEGTVLVGDFTIKTTIDKETLATNDAVTIKITLSGSGNLNKLGELALNFPTAFETLPATAKNNITTNSSGISGSKTFEFVAIPRQPGNFSIKPITVWAFNPKTKKYYSLTTKELNIKVTGDAIGDYATNPTQGNKQALTIQNTDIRYIQPITDLKTTEKFTFTHSTLHHILLWLSAIIFAAGTFIFRIKGKQKGKKQNASKTAQKYLRSAKLEITGEKDKFYALVDEALNNYFLTKLEIEQSELNKEKIQTFLTEQSVNPTLIQQTLKISNDCKMARFSPAILAPQEMYDQAVNIINQLEDQL